ncbi:MAG: hypothetical protein DDT22_01211 [candidate division WS2 bacterium]|nr:hypothetical protein [Candidatus Lithacetigena glycinireducens]
MPVNKLFSNLLKELKELILPSNCLLCNIYSQGYFCAGCQQTIKEMISPMYEHNLKVHSLFQYHGRIRQVLHRFKYDRFREAGLVLGSLMGEYYRDVLQEKYDLLVPVPLHKDELKERGFNQSEIIARGFISAFPQNLSLFTLVKIKKTRRQVNLNLTERRENLKNAFSTPYSLKGNTILIIDDVFTTGETFKACKSALLQAGAREVQGVTFCRQI